MNTAAAQGGGSGIFMLLVLAAMFLLILFSGRGQKKREAERMAKVNALQKGDSVILTGGIVGVVAGFKDNAIEVKIAEGVKVTILKSGIVGFLTDITPVNQGGAK
ncbi:MAG: preprotein translocase subunit YajC [Elusimicrobiaceae bacterium]|nr:preprotein translocase subunit YajC [Elusimicrobiaceae bacterium]MBR3899880.1 preprotein translocase subunit YajC [Elusimicrobiaceae bacterium]